MVWLGAVIAGTPAMPQYIRQPISVANLRLDPENFRIVKQDSQKATRDALIQEEGRDLVNLAKDIVKNGLSPIDLQLVVDANDGFGNFVVIEGNRRLAAIQLMLNAELAEGSDLHAAFKRLHRESIDAVPRVMDCVIVPSKKAGRVWIDRKHQSGLEGAGTEQWSAISKARADADAGIPRPELDAVNFVLSAPGIAATLRKHLQGSRFNITTLKRLVDTKELQHAAGFNIHDGKLVCREDQDRVRGILTDAVQVIASGRHKGEKFIERNIDTPERRQEFVDDIAGKHPKTKGVQPWVISGKPAKVKPRSAKQNAKSTPSTAEQTTLIRRHSRLSYLQGRSMTCSVS